MPGTGGPTARRRGLGTILQTLRPQMGLAVEQAAGQLTLPPKLSSETGGSRLTCRTPGTLGSKPVLAYSKEDWIAFVTPVKAGELDI